MKENYKVDFIKKQETYEWLLNKHYARRIPPITYAIGLYDKDNILQGIITFGEFGGSSSSHNLIEGYKGLELNRLCINEKLPKNTCSYFISKALKLLPKPLFIISYSDTNYNHHGYIYQASNWIYTGMTDMDKLLKKDDKIIHRKTFFDRFGSSSIEEIKKQGYEIIIDYPKHRYFYFLGNKRQVKEMKSKLKYPILPYPKGDNARYNADYKVNTQTILF